MRLPGFATRNLRIKGVAAVLATVMWAGVAYASNPPDTRTVTVKVPQAEGSVAPWVLVHPIPDLVVRVSGTREHLNAFDPADVVVSVDYKSISHAGIQNLPLTVVNNDRDVVLDPMPPTIGVEVDRLDSRSVGVIVDYSAQPPPQGYVVVSASTAPTTVTVIGPQHQLASVKARVTVNLSNQKTNFQAEEKVVLVDTISGQPLGSFGLSIPGGVQGNVLVTIAIAPSLTSRPSAVLPRLGIAPQGHYLAAESVSPSTVVLSGPQDLLNTLDSVTTESISLAGINGTVNLTVHIVPPAGVTASPSTVTVTVTVNLIPLPPSPTPLPTPTATPVPTPVPSPT